LIFSVIPSIFFDSPIFKIELFSFDIPFELTS
jgi:hypothetical protein